VVESAVICLIFTVFFLDHFYR